jgi:hypothetical protein
MKSLGIGAALLSGIGALMFMGMVASAAPTPKKCMIDEGNGRHTPCEALYKTKKCMIDEGERLSVTHGRSAELGSHAA